MSAWHVSPPAVAGRCVSPPRVSRVPPSVSDNVSRAAYGFNPRVCQMRKGDDLASDNFSVIDQEIFDKFDGHFNCGSAPADTPMYNKFVGR